MSYIFVEGLPDRATRTVSVFSNNGDAALRRRAVDAFGAGGTKDDEATGGRRP